MSSLQEILAGLQKSYLASMPDKITLIEALWQAKDFEKLETEYHKLKGTGRTYGLPEFTQLGEILERICMTDSKSLPQAVPFSLSLLSRMRNARVQGTSITLDDEPEFQLLVKLVDVAGRP